MMMGIVDSGTKIVVNGLVMHVDAAQKRSYPGTGTAWTDLSSQANNATLTNGPTFNSSNGGSIVFDGTNDYAAFPDSESLKVYNSFTIDGWIYPITSNVDGPVITKVGCYYVDYFSTRFISVYGYGWSNPGYHQANHKCELNQWSYFSVVRDLSASTLKIWINSTLSTTVSSLTGTISCNTTAFSLGIGGYSGSGYHANVRVAIGRVYNRALTDTEVGQNYNAERIRFL